MILNPQGRDEPSGEQSDNNNKLPAVVKYSLPVSNNIKSNNFLQKYQSLRNNNIIIDNYTTKEESNSHPQKNTQSSDSNPGKTIDVSVKEEDKIQNSSNSLNKTTASQLFD